MAWTIFCYLSTFETEIHSLSELVRSIVYARDFMHEMMGPGHSKGPSLAKCDNMAAIRHGNDRMSSARARSVRLRDFYCRQAREEGLVEFEFARTGENDSDMYTKQLPADDFERCSASARDDN